MTPGIHPRWGVGKAEAALVEVQKERAATPAGG